MFRFTRFIRPMTAIIHILIRLFEQFEHGGHFLEFILGKTLTFRHFRRWTFVSRSARFGIVFN